MMVSLLLHCGKIFGIEVITGIQGDLIHWDSDLSDIVLYQQKWIVHALEWSHRTVGQLDYQGSLEQSHSRIASQSS